MLQEACTICGGVTEIVSHGGFRFRECRRCGYGQLQADGRKDYWSPAHESDDDAYWTAARQNYFDSALELLRSMTRGRRLLDVGGGLGFFAGRALEQGWDAYTLDISPTVAERAAARVGSDRSLNVVPEAWLGSFHVVTMWCVVAHTRDPESLIQTSWTALSPQGVLWVTTPNYSFQKPYASIRKHLRRELDFGREDHVGHFTPTAVGHMLSKGGFADTRFHFRGITETCVAAESERRALVEGKRWWNRLASVLLRFDLNVMSELQVTARKSTAH